MLSYDWQQNIAEARFAEWLTVAAYLVGMAAAALAAHSKAASAAWLERAFWWVVVASLAFLAVNEVLDLQILLTVIGKQAAIEGGWYDQRRVVQFWFIVALATAALVAGTAALWLAQRTHPTIRLALFGLAFIVAFILIRAASFHHMDEWLGRDLSFIDYGTAQEMLGIALIAIAALRYRRVERHRR